MKIATFTIGFAIAITQLHAQTFSTDVSITSSGTSVPNLNVDGNGGVLFKGTGSTTGTIPATGAGTRLMWYPAKSAFRAGSVSGTQWDDANIGVGSVAFGSTNQVSSSQGFAVGVNNSVNGGSSSAALGYGNTLTNASDSVVIGASNVLTTGYASFVTGSSNLVTGGNTNFVAGNANSVSGSLATSIGEGNTSSGWGAMSIGRALTSGSAGCLVVGMSNIPIISNPTYWVGTDPIFIVGNGANGTAAAGTSPTPPAQSNSMVVLKNGQVNFYGTASGATPIVLDPNNSQITVGGQPFLVRNSNGNFGIGTGSSTPNSKLEVWGNLNVGDASTSTLYANPSTGRVGIGTNTPTGKLQLYSTATGGQDLYITKGNSGVNDQGGGTLYFDNYHNANTGFSPGVSGGKIMFRFSQPTSGVIQDGAKIEAVVCNTSSQSGGATPTDLTFSTFTVNVGLTEKMRVLASGNVGIGTAIPTAKFEVNGTAKFAGVVQVAPGGDIPMFTGN